MSTAQDEVVFANFGHADTEPIPRVTEDLLSTQPLNSVHFAPTIPQPRLQEPAVIAMPAARPLKAAAAAAAWPQPQKRRWYFRPRGCHRFSANRFLQAVWALNVFMAWLVIHPASPADKPVLITALVVLLAGSAGDYIQSRGFSFAALKKGRSRAL